MYGYYNSWVLHCVGSLDNNNFYPDKTRQTIRFKRLEAFCGVLGGEVVLYT